MAKTPEQIEKNVAASFSGVKKDILMLNDAISDLHDQIAHLSINQATLLEQFEKLKSGKKTSKKKSKKKTSKKKK